MGSGVIYALNTRMQLDASVGVDLNGKDKSYQSGLIIINITIKNIKPYEKASSRS